jgi:hypothetical protein
MSKLFVRLAASGAIAAGMAAGMGATALADGAGISTTGPGSTNVITSTTRNSVCEHTLNRVGVGNWNNQSARSGNVWVSGNTRVNGSGLGSGWASNSNWGQNDVSIANDGNGVPDGFGGNSAGNASIYLTGPYSNNRISSNNSNRVANNTINNVSATNSNNQSAKSGQVVISGNTVVEGVGGSGDATNTNTGVNNVQIDNTSDTPTFSDGSGGGNASIDTTGPGSNNQIKSNSSNTFSQNTTNNVSAQNSSQQTATTGNVIITGNTVVKGVGGSGNASNDNQAENDVGITNN